MYQVKYGNRAVKAVTYFEAGSVTEARELAQRWIDEEVEDDALFDDVRIFSVQRSAL